MDGWMDGRTDGCRTDFCAGVRPSECGHPGGGGAHPPVVDEVIEVLGQDAAPLEAPAEVLLSVRELLSCILLPVLGLARGLAHALLLAGDEIADTEEVPQRDKLPPRPPANKTKPKHANTDPTKTKSRSEDRARVHGRT